MPPFRSLAPTSKSDILLSKRLLRSSESEPHPGPGFQERLPWLCPPSSRPSNRFITISGQLELLVPGQVGDKYEQGVALKAINVYHEFFLLSEHSFSSCSAQSSWPSRHRFLNSEFQSLKFQTLKLASSRLSSHLDEKLPFLIKLSIWKFQLGSFLRKGSLFSSLWNIIAINR